MKTAVSAYLNRLEKIEAGLENQAYRIIAEIQETIIDFVRERQLFEKGIDGKGVRLEPYSPYTIALKKLKGEVYNRTTLLDTESFYSNMYVTARDGKYYITSSDSKTNELKAKYGKHIMVVTDENNKIINEKEIFPKLEKWIIQQFFSI